MAVFPSNEFAIIIRKKEVSEAFMQKWYSFFQNSTWMSIYIWTIFTLLPFFFIFRKSEPLEMFLGIVIILLYLLSYRFSFMSKNGLVYMWISFEMVINVVMTLMFGYVYLALFTAFFIGGNLRRPVGFYIMYGLHVGLTVISTGIGLFLEKDLFISQIAFVIISVIGVVILPITLYLKNKRSNLEGQLETAKVRISELVIFEERQRIARDLHDTLGQKLSMIGLKSDLAARLVVRDQELALIEIKEIRQTASIALKEVRELVSDMRTVRFEDELNRVAQILKAAEIELFMVGDLSLISIPPLVENVLSMCLKEAVTNVVKHSEASQCHISFVQNLREFHLVVQDDGLGLSEQELNKVGNGLKGMRERLEFINGSLRLEGKGGTTLSIAVPVTITHQKGSEQK